MNKLFICNQGQNRSKTASELYNGKYAGIFSLENPVTKELLEWADLIIVFEENQRKWIGNHFPKEYMLKKIINLEIPDTYAFNQLTLIKHLQQKMKLFKQM